MSSFNPTTLPSGIPASQIGAFAAQAQAQQASADAGRSTRPVLAPVGADILNRIKQWALAAIGDSLPGLGSSPATAELYVRQLMCRKPDCVPLETLLVILGDGWNVKVEIFKAADDVEERDIIAAVPELVEAAMHKIQNPQAVQAAPGASTTPGSAASHKISLKRIDGAGSKHPGASTGASADAQAGPQEDAKTGAESGMEMDDALHIVLPRDCEVIEAGTDEVYVVGTQGLKVNVIAGLDHLAGTLESLILRSHLITKMEGLGSLHLLTKLELYDNQIDALEQLEALPNLTILDMSYNHIRDMSPVAHCPMLEEIYLAQNKLRCIAGCDGLARLRKIDLGGNRIRSLEGIGQCTALEELWIGKNKIEQIQCLDALTRLRRLDIQTNRLVRIEGLQTLTALEELYLSRNGIAQIGGMESLQLLNTVDLSNNRLTSLEGLPAAPELEEVWVSANRVETFDAITSLRALPKLMCVYLEHNPIAASENYRRRLKEMLPRLTQIDAESYMR